MTFFEFSPEGCTGFAGTEEDMFFRSYVDGPDGAHFELLREKHHTDVDVKRAKAWLRRNHDVVSIKLITETF
jgi:hypothetical protein